jgi:hypothetical protein
MDAFRSFAKAPKNRLRCVNQLQQNNFHRHQSCSGTNSPTRSSNLDDLTGKLKEQSGMSTGPPAFQLHFFLVSVLIAKYYL